MSLTKLNVPILSGVSQYHLGQTHLFFADKDDSKPDVITKSIGLGSCEEHVAMTGSTAVNFLRAMQATAGFSWESSLAATATRAASDCRV